MPEGDTINIELTQEQAAALGLVMLPIAIEAQVHGGYPKEMLVALREVSVKIVAAIEAQKHTNWDADVNDLFK